LVSIEIPCSGEPSDDRFTRFSKYYKHNPHKQRKQYVRVSTVHAQCPGLNLDRKSFWKKYIGSLCLHESVQANVWRLVNGI